MKNTAIYPGTFDPITYGHIDVIKKSFKLVDKLVVAISNSNQKGYLFTVDERIKTVMWVDWLHYRGNIKFAFYSGIISINIYI